MATIEEVRRLYRENKFEQAIAMVKKLKGEELEAAKREFPAWFPGEADTV